MIKEKHPWRTSAPRRILHGSDPLCREKRSCDACYASSNGIQRRAILSISVATLDQFRDSACVRQRSGFLGMDIASCIFDTRAPGELGATHHSSANGPMASGSPPTAVEMTGVPQAIASRTIIPNPSSARVGTMEQSAAWYTAGRSSSETRPKKCTLGPRPRSRACARRDDSSVPVPQTTMWASGSLVSASRATVTPILGSSRRTTAKMKASFGRPNLLRASLWSEIENLSVSTPGRTVSILDLSIRKCLVRARANASDAVTKLSNLRYTSHSRSHFPSPRIREFPCSRPSRNQGPWK